MKRDEDVAKAFVIMPFASEFDDVNDTIKQAISQVDDALKVIRLDDVRAAGRISEDLVHELETASLCVADVTGGNANVMWEVGFAAALKKPLIVLSQSTEKLPFDIADWRTIKYEREFLAKSLKEPLVTAIRETLLRYSTASAAVAARPAHFRRRTIGVTGTMECPPEKVHNRLRLVMEPYLGHGYDWYVGSFGVVDQLAIELLRDAQEKRITVVGYTSYDISGPILAILSDSEHISFLDASAEQMPKSTTAPSARDILLLARCDTIIVGWDGVSVGTRQLLNWLSDNEKDHLVAFVPPLYHEHTRALVR